MTQRNETEPTRGREREPREIEANIEETRAAISEHLEAIGEKLSPGHMKQQAKDRAVQAKDRAVSKIRNARDSAVGSLNETAHRAGRAGSAGLGFARENPMPLALIGLGLGWLAMSARKRSRPEFEIEVEEYGAEPYGPEGYGPRGRVEGAGFPAYESVPPEGAFAAGEAAFGEQEQLDFGEREGRLEHQRERLRRMKSGAKERVSRLSHRTQDRARDLKQRARGGFDRRRGQAQDLAREKPLAFALAALAAGVGVGLLIPETRRERRLLGSRRDRLIGEAKATASEVKKAVSETSREVKESVTSAEHPR